MQSRSLWKHNYGTADGIVFLVDGTDADRLPEVAKEIKNMAADPDFNPNAAVLVIVNKQVWILTIFSSFFRCRRELTRAVFLFW